VAVVKAAVVVVVVVALAVVVMVMEAQQLPTLAAVEEAGTTLPEVQAVLE